VPFAAMQLRNMGKGGAEKSHGEDCNERQHDARIKVETIVDVIISEGSPGLGKGSERESSMESLVRDTKDMV
jgi:hypothetical protein